MPAARRLPRILLDAATAVSLVLCVATVWLWNKGRGSAYEVVVIRPAAPLAAAYARSGALYLFRSSGGTAGSAQVQNGWWKWANADPDRRFEGIAGFAPSLCLQLPSASRSSLHIPLWTIALPAGILPAIRARTALRAARRTAGGLCPACGYDLRATPTRCPECGAAPGGTDDGVVQPAPASPPPTA